MDLRLRLSLVARMAVAVAVLSSFSLVLATVVTLVGGVLLTLLVAGAAEWVVSTARGLPRLSAAFQAPPAVAPTLAALVAVVGLWAVIVGWSRVSHLTADEHLLPPSDPLQLAGALFALVCLYEAVVESTVALAAATSLLVDGTWLLLGAAVGSVALSFAGFVAGVRAEVRSLREQFVGETARADEAAEGLADEVARLALLADVPVPDVRVARRDRAEAFTVGAGSNATLVVSTGLLEALPSAELEAVLAHEVSHLANGDSRVLSAALAPVAYAEELDLLQDPDDPADWFWWAVGIAFLRYGQFGAALLSRGREWAADAGAVALTGSPSALASALTRLDERREVPREDLREWSDALVVLDVLPALSPDDRGWPFRTHPPTSERVARLERLAARRETE